MNTITFSPIATILKRAAIICTILLSSGCESLSEFTPVKPDINFSNITLGTINLNRQEFIFSFNVGNPNAFSIPITGTEFSMKFADKNIINGSTVENITLKPRSQTPLKISVSTQLLRSSSEIINAFKKGKFNVNYELNGTLNVNAIAFPIGIPFSKKGNLANDIRR